MAARLSEPRLLTELALNCEARAGKTKLSPVWGTRWPATSGLVMVQLLPSDQLGLLLGTSAPVQVAVAAGTARSSRHSTARRARGRTTADRRRARRLRERRGRASSCRIQVGSMGRLAKVGDAG